MTKRQEIRNIHVTQIIQYRLPPAGIVSILHRVSGLVMFALLPFVIWLFDKSVTSQESFDGFARTFNVGMGFVPAILFKLVVLVLLWAYLLHLIAGVRHLWMDTTHSVTRQQGHASALVTLVSSTLLTVAFGAKLFALY